VQGGLATRPKTKNMQLGVPIVVTRPSITHSNTNMFSGIAERGGGEKRFVLHELDFKPTDTMLKSMYREGR
jgi:hypothetical protein